MNPRPIRPSVLATLGIGIQPSPSPLALAHGERGGGKTAAIADRIHGLEEDAIFIDASPRHPDCITEAIGRPSHLDFGAPVGDVHTRDRLDLLVREYVNKLYAASARKRENLIDPHTGHPVFAHWDQSILDQLASRVKPQPRFDYAAWLNRIHHLPRI